MLENIFFFWPETKHCWGKGCLDYLATDNVCMYVCMCAWKDEVNMYKCKGKSKQEKAKQKYTFVPMSCIGQSWELVDVAGTVTKNCISVCRCLTLCLRQKLSVTTSAVSANSLSLIRTKYTSRKSPFREFLFVCINIQPAAQGLFNNSITQSFFGSCQVISAKPAHTVDWLHLSTHQECERSMKISSDWMMVREP